MYSSCSVCFYGVGIVSYAAAEAADSGGGTTTKKCLIHSGGTWYNGGDGKHYKNCSKCGTKYGGRNHSGGSWYYGNDEKHYKNCSSCGVAYTSNSCSGGSWWYGDNARHYKSCRTCGGAYTSASCSGGTWTSAGQYEYHYKKCSTCSGMYTTASHSGGLWYMGDKSYHYKDCGVCGQKIYTYAAHDTKRKVQSSPENQDQHETYCETCFYGRDKGKEVFMGMENHTITGGETSPHTCVPCKYVPANPKQQYHYYNIPNGGGTLDRVAGFYCKLPKCNVNVGINKGTLRELTGLPLEEYTASDAKIKMDEVPRFEQGDYTLIWTCSAPGSFTLRDANGDPLTQLPKLDDKWMEIKGWSQRNLKTHAKWSEDYANELYENMMGNGGPDWVWAQRIKEQYSKEEFITAMINKASESKIGEWDEAISLSPYKTIGNGASYIPTEYDYDLATGTYTVTYDHDDGGWMFAMNVWNVPAGDKWYTDLFVNGTYESEPGDPWVANIYYCYRTMDNKEPKNGLEDIRTYKTVVVYYYGDKPVTVTVPADMDLITKAGYRYKGVTTQVSTVAGIGPAKAPPKSTATSGTVSVSWPHNQAAAMVTFFVEPVKLSYGHKAIDYNKNVIDIVASSSEGKDLEFPDFYNGTECVISVNSLNKYWWPGYILESSKAYIDGTKTIIKGSEKKYNDNTTTILEDSSRYVVTEKVPSSYSSEKKGFADDKEFYFFYNTPIIQIEHKKYGTNDYMTSNKGTAIKYIQYMQQIINQFAYIDSLITDNVKPAYTLTIRNAAGNTESFTYSYPEYDLVQVKISEVKDGGKTVHYATLYEDDKYAQGSKCYKVTGYAGVFGKYYSESLDAIAQQIKKGSEVFNTNKNWKVEFIYDRVERVYIKFKDLKGNPIYIPDPNNKGKYIGQVTEKIPEGGHTDTPPILGDGRFKLVKYTIDKNRYVDDLSKAKNITDGTPITVPGNDGDRYIIFYYSTEKTLTVEYRDENEKTLKPKTVMEIPTTGAVVQIPEIPLFTIDGYKHNPDFDGKGVELKNNKGELMTNAVGEPIYGIMGLKRPLTVDDKEISIANPTETDHHVIIYYKSSEALKVECREELTEKKLQPPPEYITPTWLEIPELGTKIQVPTIAAYKAQYYLKNDNYNGTDTMIAGNNIATAEGINVPIHPNGNNQFLLIYYKKIAQTTNLTIEYKEGSPTGPDIREPSTIELPIGVETPVNVPPIDGYEAKYYIIPTDPDSTPVEVTEEDVIKMIGDPEKPEQKIIIVYTRPLIPIPRPGDPETPIPITPEDNVEKVYIKANNKGSEEYDVEVAVPTSEDLYVSGDMYAYRFVTKMEETPVTEYIKVKIMQRYYVDLDKGTTATLPPVEKTIPLTYNYYNIVSGDLYDLRALQLKNEAIKYYNNYDYDTNTFGTYKEKEANFPVSDQQPYLEYNLPKGVGQDENNRVQIKSVPGYSVVYNEGTDTFEITIGDIDYYEAVNKAQLVQQLENEAEAILEKCTKIKVQTLKIKLPGEDDVVILTGEKYDLPNKADALRSPLYYVPYVAGRTPLESFYYNRDLYVREEAENRNHTSKMLGDYRLIESIQGMEDATVTPYNPATERLKVEAINVNSINVHTPIINGVKLDTLNNKNITQLKDAFKKELQVKDGPQDEAVKILNLEEKFKITIPNKGDHINVAGYNDGRLYNHEGLTTLYTETDGRITTKTNSIGAGTIHPGLMKPGIINNTEHGAVVEQSKIDTEKDAQGPSYAEYKLIKFPYDVYLQNTDSASPAAGKPQLFEADKWYNLYEYVKPNVIEYTFIIPTWVQDAKLYTYDKDEDIDERIHVLIVAENCSLTRLEEALANPKNVKTAVSNEEGKNNTYILRTSYDTYVSGRLYDLQIRDTDDPGYMGKIKEALDGNKVIGDYTANEMPVAQKGQAAAYNMGMKLGYRFYFDLKTKGIANKQINIKPEIYYVSQNGTVVRKDITLFYHSKGSMYNKLSEKDLAIRMVLANSHGTAGGNGIYTGETIAAKQLNGARVFTNQTAVGKILGGLTLTSDKLKLPYDNLNELRTVIGLDSVDALKLSALNKAKTGDEVIDHENKIKDCSGHWYGEYYLPASTIVVMGENATREQAMVPSNVLTNGYLVVVFKEITTETDEGEYLTYSEPKTDYEKTPSETLSNQTQWKDEGIDGQITLPNGNMANLGTVISEGAPMAIYQVGLRANNDFETEGTH